MRILFFTLLILSALAAFCFADGVAPTVSKCDEDPEPGLNSVCRAGKPRVYYDKAKNKCFAFRYGGCGATSNIFRGLDECETECVK